MTDQDNLFLNANQNNDDSAANQPVDNATDYIAAIKDIRKNSVDKNSYNEVVEENKRLIKALSEGNYQVEESPSQDHTERIDELRNELFRNDNLSNLEFAEKTIELRNLTLETTGKDIFVANENATPYERDEAQRVADAFEHCIEIAQGDSSIFTNELQRITLDTTRFRR